MAVDDAYTDETLWLGTFMHKYIPCMVKNSVAASATPPATTVAMAATVLVLCFAFNFVGRGVGDTYMVFLLPLEKEFGWHRSQMTSVYSALMIVSGLAAPLSGTVFERFGPRMLYAGGLALLGTGYLLASRVNALWQFYACISLLGGLGIAAIGMVPAAALISRWFERRMSTAIGIAYAGFGCGSLLIVPLAQTLIDADGWRRAYQVIGATLLVLVPISLAVPWRTIRAGLPSLVAPRPLVAAGTAPVRAALRNRTFWHLVQVMFFTAVGMFLIIVQSVAYLVDVGYTPLQAATAFGAAGALSVVGVSSSGWLADRFGHRRAATVSFVGTFLGISLLLAMSYGASLAMLVAYVLLFGICQGARGPLAAGLSARLFSGPGQATIYGVIFACMSVGSGIGSLLAGALHDITGGYRAGFVLSMACVLLAALPFWTSDALVVARLRRAE
ncbi:MAG TPA: MFS transporter [Caldimonas sp.]|nr:MFS transporter [Caldimonas sp.]